MNQVLLMLAMGSRSCVVRKAFMPSKTEGKVASSGNTNNAEQSFWGSTIDRHDVWPVVDDGGEVNNCERKRRMEY